eukprot:ANDGO_00371.mRNA.1 hypothetical protein
MQKEEMLNMQVSEDELIELESLEADAIGWISQILTDRYDTSDLVRVLNKEHVLRRLAKQGFPGGNPSLYEAASADCRDIYLFLDACAHLHVPTQHLFSPADLLFYRHNSNSEKISRSQDVKVNGRAAVDRRRRLFQTILAFIQQYDAKQRSRMGTDTASLQKDHDRIDSSHTIPATGGAASHHESNNQYNNSNSSSSSSSSSSSRSRSRSRSNYAVDQVPGIVQNVREWVSGGFKVSVQPWDIQVAASLAKLGSIVIFAFGVMDMCAHRPWTHYASGEAMPDMVYIQMKQNEKTS